MPDGTMYDPPAGPVWKVTKQQSTVKLDTAGKPMSGVDVTYELGDGTTDTVFVPTERYTVPNVQAMIAAKAEIIHGVANLTSDTGAGS